MDNLYIMHVKITVFCAMTFIHAKALSKKANNILSHDKHFRIGSFDVFGKNQ